MARYPVVSRLRPRLVVAIGGFGLKIAAKTAACARPFAARQMAKVRQEAGSAAQERLLGWRRKLESSWRRELPTKRIYVTATVRIKLSIDKAEAAGR